MKRVLVVVLGIFMLMGCVSTQGENALPFEIDPVATANAPWRVGEVVHEDVIDPDDVSSKFFADLMGFDTRVVIQRVFQGVTNDGFYVAQDYFESIGPAGLPYQIAGEEYVEASNMIVHGRGENWYPSGEKAIECVLEYGASVEPCIVWHRDGSKRMEFGMLDGKIHGPLAIWRTDGMKMTEGENRAGQPVGIWRFWDANGELISEVNLGYPD